MLPSSHDSDKTLTQLTHPSAWPASAAAATPLARFLTLLDLPELLALEREKWDEQQAASPDDLARRIDLFPDLSVGAFCPRTGQLVASLFMQPAANDFWKHARDWRECATGAAPIGTATLFGISLSSRDVSGVSAILEFFWPHALVAGWRHIYLGSPVPGWREWQRANPGRGILDYVSQTRGRGLPLDPQLRYYHARGFRKIVCVKPEYFPHERSQDHGVILRGTVPLSALSPVWRTLRTRQTRHITRSLSSLLL
jgi:hypothetical protein